MNKKVLITGVCGQDGANLSEYLLKNTDHEIYGMVKRSGTPNFVNIESFQTHRRFHLVYGDLADSTSINNLVKDLLPDYFVNFGANSFVAVSWSMPTQVFDVNTLGVIRCLEAIKNYAPDCRFYQANSSEVFGNVDYSPQDEKHPLKPRSPYGASKAAAGFITKIYRESYGLYAIQGTLFNHEGIRRSEEFVTRKITKGVARIIKEFHDNGAESPVTPIELGNVDAKRDWSDSEDFVVGVWMMLNQDVYNPNCILPPSAFPSQDRVWLSSRVKEYILASGETHSIREFVTLAFKEAGIDGEWHGTELNETFRAENGQVLVKINPKFYRPAEVDLLMGDSSAIRKDLGWKPKTDFKGLVRKMVRHDMGLAIDELPNF